MLPPCMSNWTWLEHTYLLLNKRYFHSRLPLVALAWHTNTGKWRDMNGRTEFHGGVPILIFLNERLRDTPKLAQLILLHEMVHVYLPYKTKHHGKEFQREMKRLAREGAFDDLW